MSSFDKYNKFTILKLKKVAEEENIQIPDDLKKKKDIIDYILSYKDDYLLFNKDLNQKENNESPNVEISLFYENLLENEKSKFLPTRTNIYKMSEYEIYNFMKEKNIHIPHGIESLKDLRYWASGILQEIANGYGMHDSQNVYKYSYDIFIPVKFRKRIKIEDLVISMQLEKIIEKNIITKTDIIELSNKNNEYEWLNELKYVGEDIFINWRQHLVIFGWTVIEKSVKKNKINKCIEDFWNWMEGLECGENYISKDNIKTWELCMKNGKIKGKICHQSFLWEIRKEVKKYFSEIFMTDELACSFEGVDLSIPPNEEDKGIVKLKLKHDQFRIDDRFINVKGLLLLSDYDEKSGGVCFVKPNDKNVKDFFLEYIENHPSYGISSYSLVNQKDILLKNLQFSKICANKGDMIVFDTRLMYGIIDTQDNYRLGIWISQQPKINMENKTKKKRLKAFQNNLETNVWTFGPWYEEIEPFFMNNKRDKKPNYNDIKNLI